MKSIQETLELLRQTGADFAQLVAFAEKWKYLMHQVPGAKETRKGSKYPWKVPAGQAPKKEKSAPKPTVKAPAKTKASPKKPKPDMIADALQVAFDHIKEFYPDVTHDDFVEALGRMSGKKNAPAKKEEAKPKEETKSNFDVAGSVKSKLDKLDADFLNNTSYDDLPSLVDGILKESGVDQSNFKSLRGESTGIYQAFNSVNQLKNKLVAKLKERKGRLDRGQVIQKEFEDGAKIKQDDVVESEPAQPNEHIESLANQLTFSPHQDGVSKRLDHVYDAMQASAKMHGGTAPTTDQFHQMLTDAQKSGGLELHVLNEVADLTPEQRKAMPTQGDNVLGFAIIKDKAKVNQAIEGVMSGKKLSKLDKKSKK